MSTPIMAASCLFFADAQSRQRALSRSEPNSHFPIWKFSDASSSMDSNEPEIPSFAELAADPEIAPLLDFEPVPRKVKRPDGWTPELQRELIARIAATGTLQRAVWQMGKHATGAEALYKTPGAHGFRAVWDAAEKIGRRRNGLDAQPPYLGEVPGITRRNPKSQPSPPGGGGPTGAQRERGEGAWDPAPDPQEADDRWATAMTLFERYAVKLQLERQERHRGNIAAADFYLRQATFLEVCMDVTGLFPLLREAGIGEHELLAIAETPLTRILADVRRAVWSDAGEPERPAPPEHLLIDHGDCRTIQDETTGKAVRAGAWIGAAEWRSLDCDRQRQRLKQQHEADAEAYRLWIERATAAWRDRTDSLPPPAEEDELSDEEYRRRWFGDES
jgi:hypothetical protein